MLLDILKSFKNRYLRFMWKKLVRRQQNSDPTICFFLAKKVSWKVIRKLNNPFLFLLSPKKNVVEKPKRHFFLHIMFFGNILGILNYKKKPHTYRKKLIEKKICFLKNRKSLFGHQEMIWPVLATHMKRTVCTVCQNCKKTQKTNNLLLSQNKLFEKVDVSLW